MQVKDFKLVWKCQQCGAVLKSYLDVIEDQDDRLIIRKPSECYKNQGGCGGNYMDTEFNLEFMEGDTLEPVEFQGKTEE